MPNELPDKIKFEDIKGILFPYLPSAQATIIKPDGSQEVRDTPPNYINNFRQWVKTNNPYTLKAGCLSAEKEILLSITRESALLIKGLEAPIAVSASVPAGHVLYDGHRITLNEQEARDHYIDSDGDRGTLHFSDDHEEAILVKFPITMQPMRLTVLRETIKEIAYDFGNAEWEAVKEMYPVKSMAQGDWDHKALFEKRHRDVPVGLLTNAWNCYDLFQTQGMPYWERIGTIFNTFIDPATGKTQRSIDIEDYGMKAVRKEGVEATQAEVLKFGAGKSLAYRHAWALTSVSSIGRMRANQLDWVIGSDLKQLTTEIRQLDIAFRDVKPSIRAEKPPHAIDGNLVTRLANLGLIRWIEYAHADPKMPPSVMVFLTLAHNPNSPTFTTVALTDVKRENRDEGLTFAFLLAPVYDNLALLNEEGELASPPKHMFVHPIDHMAKVLATFDSTIRPFNGGEIQGYFPTDIADFKNPLRATKVANLQKAILEYCGVYGDPCPAYHQNGQIVPSPMAYGIITRSLVIDYGRDMNEMEMWDVAQNAMKLCHFCDVGSKSTSRRIRKYMLANKAGGSILAPTNVHPSRPAMGRAQLQRALKPVTLTVAVVQMDTLNQALITPSGIAKQETNEAFLPQVFNTWESYENYLKGHGFTAEDMPAKEVRYQTWTGEKRVCWVLGAKTSIKIGKLVDLIGNKFMPRKIHQVRAVKIDKNVQVTEHLVDLIMPINELIDKYNHHAFLKDAEEVEIKFDGNRVLAMMVTATFYRTGAASENIPPRMRRSAYKGIDMLPIFNQVVRIKDVKIPEPNLAFAELLQSRLRELLQQTGTSVPVQDDPEVQSWFMG